MASKKKKKIKTKKDIAFDNLAKAVGAYIGSIGGTTVLVGPIGLISTERPLSWSLCIGILGKQPKRKI